VRKYNKKEECMVKILVSRCFLGERCKWNGRSNENEEVKKLLDVVEFVPICPEVDSGLPTPRIPSEIVSPDKVENEVGLDVTEYFKNGAKIALKTAKENNIKYALLKNGSPSCGSTLVYNGKFERVKVEGRGITTKLLQENGIKVFNEDNIVDLIIDLKKNRLI
jgi:uncharacterized protein YbbK (DUF523 family)